MTDQQKRERRRRENLIFLILLYIPLSLFFIRLGFIQSRGYPLDVANFFSITIKSLLDNPFLLPKSKEGYQIFYLFSLAYAILIIYVITNQKKYMSGREHGSAEWAGKNTINPFIDKKNPFNNIIFTATEKMSINARNIKRNMNTLVIGGAGTGKTRFFVKPNIMQLHSSYVITDPKGEIFESTGNMLQEAGYKIKILNLKDLDLGKTNSTNYYNPLAYIHSETDVFKIIYTLIKNTTPAGANTGDPFWEKAETALLQSLIFFTWLFIREEEQNFGTVMKLLLKAEVKEDSKEHRSELDIIMERFHQMYPDNIAYRQYLVFKQATGKTAKSILVSTAVRLSVFNIESFEKITSKDEFELDKIGNEKTAVFIVISDTNFSFNFLVSMFYTQLFDQLFLTADKKNNMLYGIPLNRPTQTLTLEYEKIYLHKQEKKEEGLKKGESEPLKERIRKWLHLDEIEDEVLAEKKMRENPQKDFELTIEYLDENKNRMYRKVIKGRKFSQISLYEEDTIMPGYQLKRALFNGKELKHQPMRLKNHVRCMLDEFANIGQIPDFEKVLATMRSREVSANIIIQNLAQLKSLYKENWGTILGNCDAHLYLGGKEQESHKYISESLGKQTIDQKTFGKSKGRQSSFNTNFQTLGRDLMTPDEVGIMDNKNCILMIRGLRPFFSLKYEIEKHPHYKYLSDASSSNSFEYIRKEEEEASGKFDINQETEKGGSETTHRVKEKEESGEEIQNEEMDQELKELFKERKELV